MINASKAHQESRPGDWGFEEITLDWLNRFEHFLKTQHLDNHGKVIEGIRQLKPNAIAIHFRNIRAVINAAIDEELTTLYPFRRFKIRQEETAKRSLSVEALRTLRDYECEPHQKKYRDLFLLTFYLLGINPVDLFSLTEILDGRIEYRRSKTGHLFSIKVEPEAQEIIDRYRGKKYLLDVLDIFPTKQFLWFWDTLSGTGLPTFYINRNRKKVDEANRKVIDCLF